MKEQVYRQALERILAIAREGSTLITPEEIVEAVLELDPGVSEGTVFALIEECGDRIRIVDPERKAAILDALQPRQMAGAEKGDPALVDKMYRIVWGKHMAPGVRELWYIHLWENEQYRFILENRPSMEPVELAEKLGISLEEVYDLEREMFNLYYVISGMVSRGK